MQKEKGSDRSKSEFLTLGNEIIGGVRNIKGFGGVFMDERRLEEMKERWKKGRGKRRRMQQYLIRIFMEHQRQRGGKVCRTNQ